jgi:hypothetical protein
MERRREKKKLKAEKKEGGGVGGKRGNAALETLALTPTKKQRKSLTSEVRNNNGSYDL